MNKRSDLDKKLVKLEEMITIGYMNKSHSSSISKKMLHVPTMTLFTVKEVPIHKQQVAKDLQNEFKEWKKKMNHRDNFIKIHETFWNTPEG